MNLSDKYPWAFRPLGIKKIQWNSILALVSFSNGIQIATSISHFNVGLVMEYVQKDKNKNKDKDKEKEYSTSILKAQKATAEATAEGEEEGEEEGEGEETPLTPTSAATTKAKSISTKIRLLLENLKKWGINIALSLDEICVACESVTVGKYNSTAVYYSIVQYIVV